MLREQGTLVYLIAAGVFIAGCGRLRSMGKVGLPEPRTLWLGDLVPEMYCPGFWLRSTRIGRWPRRRLHGPTNVLK